MGTGTGLCLFLSGIGKEMGEGGGTACNGSRRRVWSEMKRFVSSAAIAIPHKINICAHALPAGHAWGWQVTITVDMV